MEVIGALQRHDSVASVREPMHCEAVKPMIAEVARRASLPKDAVQRARAFPRPSPQRLHGFAVASRHEEIRGSGANVRYSVLVIGY
jgi:hypothetical protein